MDIKCGQCDKDVDSMSIWLCRRNGVDYCNRCVGGRITEEISKENQDLKEELKATNQHLKDVVLGSMERKQKLEKIEHIEWTQIFNFKSDDIPIKDYFPKEWAKLKSILESKK